MRFEQTPLSGVYLIAAEPAPDERGYFARLFSQSEMRARGLVSDFVEHSTAYNRHAGTVRGLHYQDAPYGETKVIRCTRGEVFDVLLDIRPDSSTYGVVFTAHLSAEKLDQLYVPEGIAHGYQSMTDDAEMHYLISAAYEPAAARGFRFDSPSLNIEWPMTVGVVSQRDRAWPVFDC